MMQWSDIRMGAALWVAGLLALSGWVWREADDAHSRLPPLWAALTLLTGGLAAFVHIALDARRDGVRRRANALIIGAIWLVVLGMGGMALAALSAGNRATAQAKAQVSSDATAAGSSNSKSLSGVPLGDFDKAFPPGASAPAPPGTPNAMH